MQIRNQTVNFFLFLFEFIQFKAWKQSWHGRHQINWDMSSTSQRKLYCQCCLLAYTTNLGTTFSFDSNVCSFWKWQMSRKTFALMWGHSLPRTHSYKSPGWSKWWKIMFHFPWERCVWGCPISFYAMHIYYYSNNIQLSNLLDCRLGIREKSRLVKFSVRYESFYLKNCPRRNIQFSAVAIQKWGHFIFCPQQDLMEEKTNYFCFCLASIPFSFVTLSIELAKKLSYSIFPDISGFQRNHFFTNIDAFHPLFFLLLFYFELFYFILYFL